MKKPPVGWPRISSSVFYDDAPAAIDWLCRTCGFEVRLKVAAEDGRIDHSELTFGDDGLVMVVSSDGSQPADPSPARSPKSLGGMNTQCLFLYVDDIEAHHERARAAGAKILQPPTTTDYGEEHWADRGYRLEDPEGHNWWFAQRVREPNLRASPLDL